MIFVCVLAFNCVSLTAPPFGHVSIASTTLGSVASFSCNDGFQLEGSLTRTCTADGWNGTDSVCGKLQDYSSTVTLYEFCHLEKGHFGSKCANAKGNPLSPLLVSLIFLFLVVTVNISSGVRVTGITEGDKILLIGFVPLLMILMF